MGVWKTLISLFSSIFFIHRPPFSILESFADLQHVESSILYYNIAMFVRSSQNTHQVLDCLTLKKDITGIYTYCLHCSSQKNIIRRK